MQNCANKDHIIQFRPKSLAGAVSAAHTTMAAQQALRTLQEVAKGPNRPVIYTPPEMIPQWQPEYAQKVKQAVAASLDAGVSAEKVYKILDSIAAVDLDGLPADLLALCVDAGLGADTDMGGEPLLHFLLNTQYPVPLGQLSISPAAGPHAANRTTQQQHQQQQPSEIQSQDAEDQHTQTLLQRLQDLQKTIPAQHHAACGSVTLAELLKRGATPDLSDASENTALHMVVACMVSKKHFPDPAVAGQQQQPDADGIDSSKRNGTSKTAGAAQQQQLEDNDAARAAYAAAVFTALLRAGWDPAVRNANGYTVSDLILEGLSRYQTELSDLKDPEGVAQTTVALLSQKAPERKLQQFLDSKIEGVQAVVDALLLMHHLAATAEAPRKRRSVLSLVLLWLVLLLACVWWIYGRR